MGEADTLNEARRQAREPARVYPSPDAPDHWVVEAPRSATKSPPESVSFNGPNAQKRALRYAYEAFGGARFFPF